MVQWIKDAINLCVQAPDMEEIDIKQNFEVLEKRYNLFKEHEKLEISNTLRTSFMSRDLVYICSWLCTSVKSEYFQKDLMYALLSGEFTTDELIMLIVQTRIFIEGMWGEKFILQKKTIKQLKDELKINLPYNEINNRNQKEIVIITEQILNMYHAPTRIVLETIRVLIKIGYNVTVFICPSNKGLPIDVWAGPRGVMYSLKGIRDEEWVLIPYKDIQIKSCQFELEGDYISKYKKMLHFINIINPIFVYNMGMINPIADLAGIFTTVVSQGMTQEYPFSVAEIVMKAQLEDEDKERMYNEFLGEEQKKICMDKTFPVVFDDGGEKCYRDMYGIGEDEFVIAIVGSRLDQEIDNEFLGLMKNISERADNVSFAIIGEIKEIQEKVDVVLGNKVHWLGFCKNLINVYGIVDLYMNPKRIGGGWSSAMAIRAGVPVITLPDCDVALWVGEEFVVDSYTDMLDNVVRYASDSDYYNCKKNSVLVKNSQSSEQEITDYVVEKINKIYEAMEVDYHVTI
ncbi:MAG: glycosyltransferase [Lachnospiraceae bacterium]|nr:glycosyltransferase [Lachnospiraceae bacterium]